MYVSLYITFNLGFSAFMKARNEQFEAIYITSFIKVGIHTHTHTCECQNRMKTKF